MKIIVTGANGYLGQGIVRALLDIGISVTAADVKSANIDARADIMECNLFDLDNPYEYFGRPDVLLHLAWRDGFVHYSDAHIEDLFRHYMFLKSFAEAGVKRIAVMGSMHEIGFFEGSIKEDTPCNPVTPYGISKNALRGLAEMLCKQNNVVFQWLRGYYIVGNSKFGSSIFSKITKAVESGEKEFPFTQGLNQFDFIDYDEFCRLTAWAAAQERVNGIINISTGRPEKLSERVERFIRENRYDIRLQYGAFPDRPYDSKAVWGDDRKIKEIMVHKEDVHGVSPCG